MKRAKLQAARYRKGLSQEALAEHLGVSRNTISQWENGRTIPYPLYVGKLCKFFEVNDPAALDLQTNQIESSVPRLDLHSEPTQQSTSPIALLDLVSSGGAMQNKQTETVANIAIPSSALDLTKAVTQGILEAIHRLEGTTPLSTSDFITRRTIITSFLGLPLALPPLDERTVHNVTADVEYLLEEDSFALYEDMLLMSWECFRRSKAPQVIDRIDGRVNKLALLARYAPKREKERWQSLLCRFYQLSTRIAQHRMDEQRAMNTAKQAIMLAIDLEDAELIASAFYRRARLHMERSITAIDEGQKQRHVMLAKVDTDAALVYIERIRAPLAGNIYLTAAEVYAHIDGNDAKLRKQCQEWQDKVATLVYGENIEDDGTFLKLDRTALHHEKAKTFLQFGLIHDARRELDTSWKTLQTNLFTWHVNMNLTAARIFRAEEDIEGCTTSGTNAYNLAKVIQSQKGEAEVKHLYRELQQSGATTAHIRNFGMILGEEL